MKTVEQKVESYVDLCEAKNYMVNEIKNGWRIHTVSTLNNGLTKVLVVYERNLETWS